MGSLPKKSKELLKVLYCLGFVLDAGTGRGGHYKLKHPSRTPIVANQRPFITVPRHNFDHGNLHKIIETQIMCFGFSKEEIRYCC